MTIAWRNERYCAEFVRSLDRAVAHAGGGWPELVVVENGPEGAAARERFVEACESTGRSPTVVRLETNTGFSGGVNAGVARATGQVLVVANLDLTFDERFLEVLRREAFEGTWDLLAPRVVQGADRVETGVAHRTRSHRLAWVAPAPTAAGPVPAGNGACMILRRAVLERREAEAGALFDPEYHSFNEDIDLFWWADHTGLVIRYCPDLRVDHVLAGSFGGDYRFPVRPLDVQRRVMANYRVTVWKNATGFDWLGWPVGEVEYLGQSVLARGLGGVRTYAASWPDAVATVRAIRRRRGRLRPPSSRST